VASLLLIPLKLCYLLLSVALAGLAASAVLAWWFSDHLALLAIPLVFFGFFSLLGLRDFFQPRHAILRNYPITAHLRFLFEKRGELLSGCRDRRLAHAWAMARADSFAPAAEPAFEAIAEAAE
jgi:hypothetical protein